MVKQKPTESNPTISSWNDDGTLRNLKKDETFRLNSKPNLDDFCGFEEQQQSLEESDGKVQAKYQVNFEKTGDQ